MRADVFGIPMFNGDKEPAPAVFQGKNLRSVGSLHDVWGRNNDFGVMLLDGSLNSTMRGEKLVFSHEAQNSFSTDLDPLYEANPPPDFAVVFTDEQRGCPDHCKSVRVVPRQSQRF